MVVKNRAATLPAALARRAPTSFSTDGFHFLELPAEIRNIIYLMVLETDAPLEIVRHFKNPRRVMQSRHTVVSAALLCANIQINREATPLLYGVNKFKFETPLFLLRFLRQIGPLAGHKRRVHLDWLSRRRETVSAFKLLMQAQSFDSLTIARWGGSSQLNDPFEEWMDFLKLTLPWLKTMQKHIAHHGERKDALAVLEIGLSQEYLREMRFWSEERNAEYIQRCKDAVVELRKAL